MKPEVLSLRLDDFADWEGAFLAPALRNGLGVVPAENGTAYIPKTLSPTKERVHSMGGITVVPDYTATTIPAQYAALILVGGTTGWQSEEAQQVVPIVENALSHGRLVGAICGATCFLGAHEFCKE